MNYRRLPQENKAEILENAVINSSPEELAKTYKELGYVEFSARALGLACRFRGAEIARLLIGLGAGFDIPKTEDAERLYHVYAGLTWSNYRSDFSLYLLDISKQIKGACCCKGLRLAKKITRKDKSTLKLLPDSERAEALQVLIENADKISFSPSELLYYAIFARDEFIVNELKRHGFGLSELREAPVIVGGRNTDFWYEWLSMTKNLSDEDFLPVMKMMSAEIRGAKFYCTKKLYDLTKRRFSSAEVFEFFLEGFKTEKLNKTQIVRDLIDINAVGTLGVIEKTGWLKDTKRREEIIAYAQERGDRVECVAWLLDYKNRTADLAAERLRAEKKIERELNASPNSVTALSQIWSFTKCEGGLRITNYKGHETEVVVPERIGKSAVVEIGAGAFVGNPRAMFGNPHCKLEQFEVHQKIEKLTLPETIRIIGEGAFSYMRSLREINLPNGLKEIGKSAFMVCNKLERLVIPSSVISVGMHAFNQCTKLSIVAEKGSAAEAYCERYGIRY